MDLTLSRRFTIALALTATISFTAAASAQPKGALIKGCDGSICVLGSFNGRKWITSTEKDERSDKAPDINYSGFTPETITIYTGTKALNWADGKLTTSDDDRTYKVPSATAIAK